MNTGQGEGGLNRSSWRSPVGLLRVVAGREGVREILCDSGPGLSCGRISEGEISEGTESALAVAQLQEYFEGKRRSFSLRLDFDRLSPFAVDVLKRLSLLPFGRTATYGELAALAGRPGAARAVGRAMAVNPFLIIVPCHRVLGAQGKMTGYSGGSGIETKRWLLSFERDRCEGVESFSAGQNGKSRRRLKSA